MMIFMKRKPTISDITKKLDRVKVEIEILKKEEQRFMADITASIANFAAQAKLNADAINAAIAKIAADAQTALAAQAADAAAASQIDQLSAELATLTANLNAAVTPVAPAQPTV